MSFFAEDSLFFQGFVVRARFSLQFDANPQAAGANFLHGRTADRAQLLEKVFAKFGRSFDELFLDENADCRAREVAGSLACA